MKLRRNRQSLLPVSGMSDDNKIRLQLALDIEAYNAQVRCMVYNIHVHVYVCCMAATTFVYRRDNSYINQPTAAISTA